MKLTRLKACELHLGNTEITNEEEFNENGEHMYFDNIHGNSDKLVAS